MNKIITLSLILISSVAVMAQDDDSKKPGAGSWTTEVNFAPFSSSPVNISYIRLRKFTSDKMAVRLGAFVGLKDESPNKDVTRSSFELNLRPGIEWHMTGTDRISPFIGFEVDIATKSSKEESDALGAKYEIDGAWTGDAERGFTRFGANFIMGVDVYIIKRLYLGTEIGFGFENINDATIKEKDQFGTNKDEGGKRLQLGPNFNSAIRLGFVF